MKVLSAILGVFMVIAGIFCLCHPVITAISIGWLIGILLIVGGINSIVSGVKKSGWDIFFGIISILAGIMVACSYLKALFALNVIVTILAVLIIMAAVSRIMVSIDLKKSAANGWGLVLASGILSLILGIIILVNPLTGMLLLDWNVAFVVIMQGVGHITAAFVKEAK